MTMRPVIGIVACNRRVGPEDAQAVMNRYVVAALTHADVSGVLVPALPDLIEAEAVAARIDALLLTGSPSNVAPSRYGDASDGDGPYDRDRDETALRLAEAMIARGRPVFGICRGFQELNVMLGGTLRRDVSAAGAPLPHHAPDDAGLDAMFGHRHPVTLERGGVLSGLYGVDEIEVNSVHYQGIATLAPAVRVEAIAGDGLVEAFSASIDGAPVMAVQWHPEWRTDTDERSRRWFEMFGRAARGLPLLSEENAHAAR